MNAVEIEAAVSDLASAPYDASDFPFQFLAAFDKKETTLKRLRKGDSKKSDVPGAVLLVNNIHLATCPAGQTRETLDRLRTSPKTASARAKFIFATDGAFFEAEDATGAQEPVADFLPDLANHFGFFLPLAGISTVREIKDNPIDVRATGRLNKLYVELLRTNPDWGTAARRHDMNHFMARLIFCYFAEHTDIFHGTRLFTDTLERMSEPDGSNTHLVMEQIFRAMDIKPEDRAAALERDLPLYAGPFPYVNGGLFRGSAETPHFNRIARSYLLQAGKLEWQHINPDIFGSMIQAVADDEERGALGMHYTSVPNILKVLNPLFLDDLRAQLEAAGTNGRMLLNLRQRMSRIRVFDPACGSGNFLVIAYKQMRSIEAQINKRRDEVMRSTDISEKNFRGIELRDFAAEIARLALIIAKYQCDVQHRGPLAAKAEFLPLKADNWIVSGNALRLDWSKVCPPDSTHVTLHSDDLFQTPLAQPEINFEREGGETYICTNPPYLGGKKQSVAQKEDMRLVFGEEKHKNLDYVCAFIVKAAQFLGYATKAALVTTNSISQGTHVPVLWPLVYRFECQLEFAYESFKWNNNAQRNAGVACTIIGLTNKDPAAKWIYAETARRLVSNISPYLVEGSNTIVDSESKPKHHLSSMITGNAPYDGGCFFFTTSEARRFRRENVSSERLLRQVSGTSESIDGIIRFCLWIDDSDLAAARKIPEIRNRLAGVLRYRRGGGQVANSLTKRPHQFRFRNLSSQTQLLVPQTCSETRAFLPVGLLTSDVIITHAAHAIYDPTLVDFSVLVSTVHLVWVTTTCGKLESRIRYSSNLGWNTFPVPSLTDQNKVDLTRCAEDILLAREAHFPATIADLYNPETMPQNLRNAHEANDETLERIYIGRRFRNDTERLEKLFDMYTKMTAASAPVVKPSAKRATVARAGRATA